ncbi:caspase family protein [Polaromonas sp. UC242_47]|uniref:caspase family protein n=1 Tax=Polaromonas sp. UC242_47 TaxID=3374626 RepID=UPI0037C8F7B1
MKLAIVAGVTAYQHLLPLNACTKDAEAFRVLLDETKSYAEVCFLPPDITGLAAKKMISEFVQKYKSQTVDELLFYFSGHGTRFEDDFFFAFADFKSDRKEGTGLRNTELDGLIRNLSPELTIKIVDACNSGSTYIKADDIDIAPVLEKSAKDNLLKKLYFLHSSDAEEASWAGPEFSHFTYALLESLTKQIGPVRYRDIMADVADEMHRISGPRPTFVVQADNTEVFVDMDTHLSDTLKQALGLKPANSGASSKDPEEDTQSSPSVEQSPQEMPIAKLAALKAHDTFCSEEEAKLNLSKLNALVDETRWPTDIKDAFKIEFREVATNSLPNRVSIGRWITGLKEDSVFATPTYDTEKYTTEEYREVPKKPGSSSWSLALSSVTSLERMLGKDKEYKLEKVERQRQVLSGFQYTVDPVFVPRQIYFDPRLPSLERYAVTIILLFSRRNLNCLYAIEHLRLQGWDETISPEAKNWKQITVPLKDVEKINAMILALIAEVSEFISTDARSRLAA